MTDPYITCPTVTTKSFIIRLIEQSDSEELFLCYHNQAAVALMNDDNCDFGFYVESPEQMATTVKYWLQFYQERAFIRFAVVDRTTGAAVGTVEGFHDQTGVLRIDIRPEYEKKEYLGEILTFAGAHFGDWFQNECLVTKAVKEAAQRRAALVENGWEFIDKFRNYQDHYEVKLR